MIYNLPPAGTKACRRFLSANQSAGPAVQSGLPVRLRPCGRRAFMPVREYPLYRIPRLPHAYPRGYAGKTRARKSAAANAGKIRPFSRFARHTPVRVQALCFGHHAPVAALRTPYPRYRISGIAFREGTAFFRFLFRQSRYTARRQTLFRSAAVFRVYAVQSFTSTCT